LKWIHRDEDLSGVKIGVQGVGHVGYYLCKNLHEAGAELFISDVNQDAVDAVVQEFDAVELKNNDIYGYDLDVFAPCAMGAILDDDAIPRLKAKVVAGAANNQLAVSNKHGGELKKRGILYAPDYAINAGGLINVANELEGYNQERAFQQAEGIYDKLMEIFRLSDDQDLPTNFASDQLAEDRIRRVAQIKTFYTSPTVGVVRKRH